MKLQAPGYYTNGDNSVDALILEARGYLAARYNWTGRSEDIFYTFNKKRWTPAETLARFDDYNNHAFFWHEANAHGL